MVLYSESPLGGESVRVHGANILILWSHTPLPQIWLQTDITESKQLPPIAFPRESFCAAPAIGLMLCLACSTYLHLLAWTCVSECTSKC